MKTFPLLRATLLILQLQVIALAYATNFTSTDPQQRVAAANFVDAQKDTEPSTSDPVYIESPFFLSTAIAVGVITLCCIPISWYACYAKGRKASSSNKSSTSTTIELNDVVVGANDEAEELKKCVSAGSASSSSSDSEQGPRARPTLRNYNSLHSVISSVEADRDEKTTGSMEMMVKNLSLQDVANTQRSNTLSASYSIGECLSPGNLELSTRARKFESPKSATRSALKMPMVHMNEDREIIVNELSPRPPPPPPSRGHNRINSRMKQYNHGRAIPEVLEDDGCVDVSRSSSMTLHDEHVHDAFEWLPLPPKKTTMSYDKSSSAASSEASDMTYMTASTLMTMDTELMQREMSPSHASVSSVSSSESCHLRLVPVNPNPLHATVSAEVMLDDDDREKTPDTPLVSDEDEMSDDTSSLVSDAGVAEQFGRHAQTRDMDAAALPRPTLDINIQSATTEYDSTTSSFSSANGLFEVENDEELTE